jgi:hypothetical protein
MTFTLENTKDATHLICNKFFFVGEKVRPLFLDCENSKWKRSMFTKEWLLASKGVIELLRPIGERKEDFEMNTDKLIPISYVKRFTPLVVGDVLYNEKFNLTFVIDGADGQVANLNEDYEYAQFFVISFADRPNTGAQPVGDDVVVDCYVIGAGVLTRKACAFGWSLNGNISNTGHIKSWKPNKDAMLKQYQAGQAKADRSKLAISEIDALFGALLGGPVAPCNGEIPKPVFTQAMADAGELPAVGAECMVKSGSLDDWYKGECIGFDNNEDGEFAVFAMFDDYPFPVRYAGFKAERIKPIQTDEEKLKSALMDSIEWNATWEYNVDKLLASDKFTITLKG